MSIWNLAGTVAAITGAASGIGRALAHRLARDGAIIAAADRNSAGLASLADELRPLTPEISTQTLDVADRLSVFEWADEVARRHGHVEIIVNNAGVALVDTVATLDDVDFNWLMSINFWGVVYGCKLFLEVYREPLGEAFASKQVLFRGDRIEPLFAPTSIAVADLLP